jgi:hydrogenase nickel incorporation protein HypA/HybF
LIEQQATQHGAKRVTGVWLKIGAFSCVETSALTFCFELVCRGTLAEGCELHRRTRSRMLVRSVSNSHD